MSAPGAAPFRYDAYVSYAEADREWVEGQLAPHLQQAGRRLCLEHDLPPGGVELEERSHAVATSRKTLLVLSPSYLDSRWALLEEAVTHQLDPAARKRRLIPVLRSACEAPLRIRPLVAVDLRDGDHPGQWQRLLHALDPAREEELSLAQRWSLRLSTATAELVRPSWHTAGAAWLLAAYLALAAAVALVHILLWHAPPLRHILSLVLAAPSHGLAALVWREDHDLFRRLSHLCGRSLGGRGAVLLAVAAVAAAWWSAGVPAARELLCGRWGCQEEGTIRLTLEAFRVAPSDSAETAHRAFNVQRVVEQKLSAAGPAGIAVLSHDLPQLGEEARQELRVDFTIRTEIRQTQNQELTATAYLYDRHFQPAPPVVNVRSRPLADGDEGAWLDFQHRLTLALLDRMGIALPADVAAQVAAVPTSSPRALELNEEGFGRLREGRYDEAEEALRAAVELDPHYAAAWSNRGEAAWRQGRYDEALEYHRNAVAALPSYAPLHYNLGHLLALLGQDREAREVLRHALALDPAHVSSYNELGNVLLAGNEAASAAEQLRLGLRIAPDFAPLAKNLGRALLASGDAAAAANALDRALTLYPEVDWLGHTEAHALLIAAHDRRDDAAAACRHLDQLRRLDPEGVAPWWPQVAPIVAGLPCTDLPPKEDPHV